jgi:hopene-associated glycosyltransferase HpnB
VVLTALSVLSSLTWIYILIGRGWFWVVSRSLTSEVKSGQQRRVVAVIPARNEAAVIGEAISSLLSQDFNGLSQIIVVDDASRDGTGTIVREIAKRSGQGNRVTVLSGKPLIAGWTGKLWALSQGVAEAVRFEPDYLLLTDADIRHGPSSLKTLVSLAETGGYDLTSCMVKLACDSIADKTLIPAFVFFFLQLYPPAWIASHKYKTAGAAGGCILIRPEALQRIGGLQTIRNAVIDDCALAQAVKRGGGRLWIGLTKEIKSVRSYGSFAEVGRMISRTAFNQLKHSKLLLAGTLTALFIIYILPIIALFTGSWLAMICGASAWLLMAVCYWPMVRFYNQNAAWSLALPLIALFYAGATIRSAVLYWMGQGGEWKGRAQDPLQ